MFHKKKYSEPSTGKPNYAMIRNLEIELGFEDYPKLPGGAQMYGTSLVPPNVIDKIALDIQGVSGDYEVLSLPKPQSLATADSILKEMYAHKHAKHDEPE